MQGVSELNTVKNKTTIYSNLILKYFLTHEMVTNKQLADEIGLSEKTIRTKIDSINYMLKENNLGTIEKKPRIGMWLECNTSQRAKIQKLISADENELVQSDKSRMVLALREILNVNSKKRLTSKDLADTLYLSVPTMLKVISDCKDWLNMFDIKLNVIRNKGIELEYSETSYRLALKNYITKLDETHSIYEGITYFMPGLQVDIIKDAILEVEKEWGFNLVDESFDEILVYTSIAVYENVTNKIKNLNISKKEFEVLSQYSEYHLAEKIYKKIQRYIHVDIPDGEIAFLSIQILCSKMIDYEAMPYDTESLIEQYDAKLKEFVEKMIDVISNVTNVDLRQDTELYNGLLIHLRPTIFRLKYNRSANNELTGYIKNEYTTTFRVSWLISVLFEEYFNLKITEDELSFITIYIQSALERNSKPISAILVSNASNGINQMICDKLRRNCAEIKKIHVQSMHDFSLARCKDDLILTTKNLHSEDDRIVEIDDWLSDSNLNCVKDNIKKLSVQKQDRPARFNAICHELFEPDLIFCHLKVKDKKSLLSMLCNKLVDKGYVTKKYFKTVMERENMTPTSIGNGVAIPHGDTQEVNTAKIVIATLDKPILWDSKYVDVVFLLVVKFSTDFEIRRTQQFYKQYIKLVDGDEQVSILRGFTSNIDFYRFLIQ